MAPPSVHKGIKKKKREREYKYRQSRPMYLERVRGESIRKKKRRKKREFTDTETSIRNSFVGLLKRPAGA